DRLDHATNVGQLPLREQSTWRLRWAGLGVALRPRRFNDQWVAIRCRRLREWVGLPGARGRLRTLVVRQDRRATRATPRRWFVRRSGARGLPSVRRAGSRGDG